MKKRWFSAFLALALLLSAVCGCAAPAEKEVPEDEIIEDIGTLGTLLDAGVPLAGMPAISIVLNPSAPGSSTEKNSSALIDYSNAKDGYVMVKWTGGGNPKLKVLVMGPNCTRQEDAYQYFLRTDGEYDVFPLSDGNGKYKISVHKNISGNQYSGVLAASINVQLDDEFAPFLRPNQYVNYSENSEVVKMAQKLVEDEGAEDNLTKVGVIYDWVVSNLSYDTAKAKSVQPGYLPDVDSVMKEKKGICFDYASLMAAMLRSQGVPIKLVVGYTSRGEYHAWINVWSEEGGWVEGMIYFDGKLWNLMDPTFASSGKQSNSVMQYISNSSNYTAKYLY